MFDSILNSAKELFGFDVDEKNQQLIEMKTNDSFLSIIDELQKHISFLDTVINDSLLNRDEIFQLMEYKKQHIALATKEINFLSNGAKIEVAVVGNFSSGKSTFINSFLGEDVCPMSVEPTTSSVTKFYFLPTKKITKDSKEITQEEYLNFSRHKQNIRNSKTYSFNYGYPFVDFANINLYDTPGFSNDKNNNDEKVTLDLLKKADVILYIVDVNTGTVKADELKRLKTLKDKQIYCILNKADISTAQNIQKVSDELISKNIFKKVLPYSSMKVLEEVKNNILKTLVENIQRQKIPNKEKFSIVIKGEEEQGRRISKYKVTIRDIINEDAKQDIDISYIKAFQQKEDILQLLQSIAKEQSSIVENSIYKDRNIVTDVSKNYLKELLDRLEVRKTSPINLSEQFITDIDETLTKIDKYEEKLFSELNILNEYKKCFNHSIRCEEVPKDEKSYFFNPYYKIIHYEDKFEESLENIKNGVLNEYFLQMETILGETNNQFKKIYNFEFDFIEKSELDEIVVNKLVKILAEDYGKYYHYEDDYLSDDDYYEEYKNAKDKRKEMLDYIDENFKALGIIDIININNDKVNQKIGELKAQKTTDNSTELQNKIETYIKGL